MTNVLIVDDERLVQELFSKYIESASDRYTLVDSVFNAENAEIVCEKKKVDLILMDVCTASGASGIEATSKIKQRFPKIKIIIVTSAPEFRFIEKAKKAKANSFWYKDLSQDELLSVMDKTMNGEKIYPTTTPVVDVGLAKSFEFTKTELEVLLHLVTGMQTKDIANKMGVSFETTKWHIKRLMEKTGCTSRTQLAIFASKSKLVLPEY